MFPALKRMRGEFAVSDLIAKRLSTLVSLTWPGGVSGYETAVGTVTENNQKDGIAIVTEDGEEVLVAYHAVYSLRIPKAVSAVSQADAQVVSSADSPTGTSGTPSPNRSTGDEPFLRLTLSAELSAPSDKELRELFSRLPKKDRKRLNGSFDSFKYGVKCNDADKMTSAADSAARQLLDGYAKGYKWDVSASRFCGTLYRRAGKARADVYLPGGWYWEASCCACQTGEFVEAGAYAVLALLEPQWRHGEDLLEILKYCSAVTYDISGVLLLWDRIPDRMEAAMPSLIDALFLARKQRPAQSDSIPDALTRLKALYPNTAVFTTAAAILNGRGDNAVSLPASVLPYTEQTVGDTERHIGWVSQYDRKAKTGEIISGGEFREFQLDDVTSLDLRKKLNEWADATDSAALWVEFTDHGESTVDLIPAKSPLVLARELADNSLFREAIEQCRAAVESPDVREALGDMVRYALDWNKAEAQPEALAEVAEFYEAHQDDYPRDAWHIAMLGQLYFALNNLAAAVEYMRQTLEFPHLSVKLRVTFLAHAMRYCVRYYQSNPDLDLMRAVRDRAEEWLRLYQNSALTGDIHCKRYYPRILRWKCRAECELNMTEEAEQDYLALLHAYPYDPSLPDLRECIRAARERAGNPAEAASPEEAADSNERSQEPDGQDAVPLTDGEAFLKSQKDADDDGDAEHSDTEAVPDSEGSASDEAPPEVPAVDALRTDRPEALPEAEQTEAPEKENAVPYVDRDGWEALHMTKQDAAAIAFGIRDMDEIPATLVCLKAGSLLNPELLPLYHAVSLAANDPLAAPDYSPASLMNETAEGDPDYLRLNDWCLTAAFLRSSFQSGREFDYSARAVRDGLSVVAEIPALPPVFGLLDAFRDGTGCGIDEYAGYRNGEANHLLDEMTETVRLAGELYEKYIIAPPRESVRFRRLLETKKILFSRDGELASLLRMVKERDEDALRDGKVAFSRNYLNNSTDFSPKQISVDQIDGLIGDCWEQALKTLQVRKSAATLQGNRRNNIRSAVSEILSVVCRWYEVEERSGGVPGRTEDGEALYQRIAPDLLVAMGTLSDSLSASVDREPEECLGMFLLAQTVRELSARLDGSWRPGQERELYTPFLMSDRILLREDLLPDLTATFCALPEFHIFARVREYLSTPKLDYTERLAQIYGSDKAHNNYGTAAMLVKYLESTGQGDGVSLPAGAERFAEQSALQAEMRLRKFLENYALAKNRGQILRSDAFANTLESDAQRWYRESVRTGNYGFFFSLLQHAEAYIHASAKRYGEQLEAQLHTMMESSPDLFDGHPEYEKAVRTMVEQQNFIAAEDSMHRIRLGDFAPECVQPEALSVLADFWARYDDLYHRVADTSRSLAWLLGFRTAGETASGAQRLAGNWMGVGNPSTPEKVEELLSLLGWGELRAEAIPFEADGQVEVYRMTQEQETALRNASAVPADILDQWAARDGLYVICLSGVLDCTRLCEKARELDKLGGNLILLLDCALSAADRHALARDMKRNGFQNDSIVIDRVLAGYLADAYQESGIQQILLAAALPFSGCLLPVPEVPNSLPVVAQEAQELLAGSLAYLGLSVPDSAVVAQILALVNYLPGLIPLYARKLAEALREPDYVGYDVTATPPYVLSDSHLRRVLSDRAFVEQVREGVFKTLSPDERRWPLILLLGWMSSVEPSEWGYSAADVLRHAKDMGVAPLNSMDVDTLSALLRDLQGLNILRGVREDTWALMSRLVRDSLGSDEELLEKLAEYGEAE